MSIRAYLVAGEVSGDLLGARLMDALGPQLREVHGVGGEMMTARGLRSLFPMDEIALFGITSVIRHVPNILRRVNETVADILARKPDVLVLIDCPGFTRRVGRKIRAQNPDIPIVFYVSPTVWAWRPGRAKEMRPYVDRLLALLPFEPAIHQRLGGPPCTYVGHSIAERVADMRPSAAEEARRNSAPPQLLVLPGSRRSEVTRLSHLFGGLLGELKRQYGPFEVVLPTVPHVAALVHDNVSAWPVKPRVVTDEADKYAAFRTARAALAASGTVTLELAVSGVPMIVAYKTGALEAFIAKRLLTTDTAALSNLVLGEKVSPEYIQHFINPPAMVRDLLDLLNGGPLYMRQKAAFKRLDAIMGFGGEAPSQLAARAVLETAASRKK